MSTGAATMLQSQSYWLQYDGTGPAERRLEYTSTLCQWCGKPLTKSTINRRYYTLICDNYQCYLFGQPQGNISKEDTTSSVAATTRPKNRRQPGYLAWLFQKRINYRLLRNVARLPCKEAANRCSAKQTKAVLEQLGLASAPV